MSGDGGTVDFVRVRDCLLLFEQEDLALHARGHEGCSVRLRWVAYHADRGTGVVCVLCGFWLAVRGPLLPSEEVVVRRWREDGRCP